MTKTLTALLVDAKEKKEKLRELAAKDSAAFVLNEKQYHFPFFLLNIGRRVKTKSLFFEMMEKAGFTIERIAKTLYFLGFTNNT